MQRTRDVSEVRLDVDWSDMKDWIVKRLEEMFHNYPGYFFTERDIHSVLCEVANEELRLCGVEPNETSDGHEVSLVHHEYPTPFRCDMEGWKFEKKHERPYKRGHYDLVILNPAFVSRHTLDVVCAKDFQIFEDAMKEMITTPLIWACEVAFFPRVRPVPKHAIQIIEQDALKVKETLIHKVNTGIFCRIGSVLVFTSHAASRTLELKQKVQELKKKLNLEVTFTTA